MEPRSIEPPPSLSVEMDESPKNVIDFTPGKTFHVGIEAPPRRNLSNSAVENLSDTSGDRNIALRVRARTTAVPARYRQLIKEESRSNLSASSVRKNNGVTEIIASSTREKTSAMKFRKNTDSWRGSWTKEEHHLFEDGCILHGWGNWKKIQEVIPTRDRHQVKSHAQKYEKNHPEGKERLQREHAHQVLLPSQTKKGLASCLRSVSSRDMTLTSTSDSLIISPPETTSKPEKKSKIFKLDPPKKHAELSKDASPHVIKVPQVLYHPTSYFNETDDKSAILVPKTGNEVLHMLAIPHGTKTVHAPMKYTKALIGAPPRKEAKMFSPHESYAASPLLLSSPHETNISSTKNEFNSLVRDQPRKRASEECAPPIKKKKSVHDFDTPCSGSWTEQEHMQFLEGCVLFGWGNWKTLESLIPSRNSVKIKSHAQKFSKNHPYEKERLLREHEEYVRRGQPIKRDPPAENETGQGKKQNKSAARRLPPSKNALAEEWSLIEKKQFEDGCVFHGWGNWRDIASHIITKDISQVSTHAESYHLKDKERLEKEHTLHYQDDADYPIVHAEKKKFHHDLLLQGGKKAESGMSTPSPPKSTPNTNDDDFGAAEAILALNCANWDGEKHTKKVALIEERSLIGSKESPKTEGAADFFQGEAKVVNKVNEPIEMSAVVSLKEDQAIGKYARMTVDMQSDKVGSMSESDVTDLDDCPVMGSKVEAPIAKSAPTRPRGNQPPPHWLATDTWDMCLANIHRWNKKLTESERNTEYLHYDRLSISEKECLRKKLVNLMDNRPTPHHP
ncbi:hypothetical protein ACHAW5_000487 [Stephanodiscus triporus]|uniref:Uncharacterized protein n=1 Tax=Stephanodiscus triporus TaxID=2934178 RepID=A0ABD3MM94_9STRA